MAVASVVSIRRRRESSVNLTYARLPVCGDGIAVRDDVCSMLLNGVKQIEFSVYDTTRLDYALNPRHVL